jgi:quercetin dioxygenase-like cupin family protein
MILTTRDLTIALSSAALTLAVAVALNAAPPVLSSTIFDWNSLTPQPNKTGAVRRVVQAPTPTLDELEIHITTLNPGETPHPPHKHANEELVIIKEGTVEALVNGELKRVGPGSIIFQASNQMHSLRNVGSVPATYHVIAWKSPGMLKPAAGSGQ